MDIIRILIVEDQNFIRKAIGDILQTQDNFSIVGEAHNGIKALELVTKIAIDIAIVDLDMPEMNGIELTEKISKNFPQIKVIILSGHEDSYSITKAIDVGAKGYLLKGLSTEKEIIDTINGVKQGYFQLGPGLSDKLVVNKVENNHKQTHRVPQTITEEEQDRDRQNLVGLKEEIQSQSQQIRYQLFEELNLEIDRLQGELQDGLSTFQSQVATRIESGFRDFNQNQNQRQSQFIPEIWQKRYLNLSQSLNFIESRYNLSINKLKEEITILRYCIYFILMILLPIIFSIFLSFKNT